MKLGFSVDTLLPLARGGGPLRIGLAKLEEGEWLEPNPDLATRKAAFDGFPGAVQLTPEAEAPGEELAAMPPAAVAMAKQLLNTSFERDFETLLELVKFGNMHLTETADFKAAVAAWLASETPKGAQR